MNETEIYLSYAHEDRPKVEKIVTALRARGWTVFFDRELLGGVKWEKALMHQLETAYAVLVVWSAHSVASEREAEAGLAKNSLYAVKLGLDITPPPKFSAIQAVDLSDWNEDDPNDPKFDPVDRLIYVLWEAQRGLRKPVTPLKCIRFKARPEKTEPSQEG